MHVFRSLDELADVAEPLHLAFGVFDGVHIGHQEVLKRATDAASTLGGKSGLVTFDPHPIRVIAPGKAPKALLSSLSHKASIIEKLGLDLFVPLHFDESMARCEAADFLQALCRAPVKTVAVGEDWRFGHNRGGSVELLREWAEKRGFSLAAVPPVMFDGDRISSTRIRQAIHDGNLADAAKMLGRPYSITGKVIKGKQLGRTLSFPTANIAVGEHQLPPQGVYAVRIMLADRSLHHGVANLGVRPTIGGDELLLETHVFDFSGNLYGQEMEVAFLQHLREERKFGGIEPLKQQISTDAAQARAHFGMSL